MHLTKDLTIIATIFCIVSTLYPSFNILSSREQGQLTQAFAPHTQYGPIPAQYFLCGFAFQQMKWIQSIPNCNCKKVIVNSTTSWKCDFCDNNLWTKSSGFKGIFCHYQNWTKQIIKTFDTGNKQVGGWRQYKCPQNYYGSNIASRFGVQYDQDIGFNGAKIQCENIDNGSKIYIQDTHSYELTQLSQSPKGTFISGYKIKYQPNGKLTGVEWFWQGFSIISNVQVKYLIDKKPQKASTYTIQTLNYSNHGYTTIKQPIIFTKSYSYSYKCASDLAILKDHKISNQIIVNPMNLNQSDLQENINYIRKIQPFKFDKQISITNTPKGKNTILIPPFVGLQATSKIDVTFLSIPYEGQVTFTNIVTKEVIMTKAVTGIWNGTMTSAIVTQTEIFTSFYNMPFSAQLKWRPNPDKYYKVVSALDDKQVFDISASPYDKYNLILYRVHGGGNQLYNFKLLKDNKYSFSSKQPNKPLVIANESIQNGGRLAIGEYRGKDNEYYELIPANFNSKNNAFYLKTFCGKVVGSENGSSANGVKIMQMEYTGNLNQIYIITDV